MNNKTLIFEGAGWAGADSSINSGVGNCRIRTRIRNNDGRLIYLEMGGWQATGKHIPKYAEGFKFVGRVDHCFYVDSKWDARRCRSSELAHVEREHFEYNKESILKFVNEKLNCSFDSLEIINEGLYVHDTEEPLCDCSKPGYIPYQEKEYNISELDGVMPIQDHRGRGFAQYRVNYEFVKDFPFISEYMNNREGREKQQFPYYNYYFSIRWNKDGIITSLELSARENFCVMSFGSEVLEKAIKAIKNSAETPEPITV